MNPPAPTMSEQPKKLYIKTYGCQMNVYDSEKMIDILRPHGFGVTEELDVADMIILNTCHIREKAAEKVYSELGRIALTKKERRTTGLDTVVVVAGCVAQAEGEEVVRRAPCVDIVVGPQSYHHLPVLLEEVKRKKSWSVRLEFEENTKFDSLNPETGRGSASKFLSIQEGCDKFCHFCVVPYTRGAEFSRSVENVYREALLMASNGVKELTLLGQNVSAYSGKCSAQPDSRWSLAQLIAHIATIPSIQRLRYTTSHPCDMIEHPDLIAIHGREAKLMPYLHLPVQSGSNRILKAMNRKHDRNLYLDVISSFRQAQPDIAFSSDFIVGYPGETEDDFADTMQLVREVGYAQAYSFMYSERPGTPAAAQQNQIPLQIKQRRLQELQELLREQQLSFNQSKVGQRMTVLFEKPGRQAGQLLGKSPYMQSVICDGTEDMIGSLISVEVTQANQNSLLGRIIY